MEILSSIDKIEKTGRKVTYASIARQFGVDRSKVGNIHKNQEAIKDQDENGNLVLKTQRPLKKEDVDTVLHLWIK